MLAAYTLHVLSTTDKFGCAAVIPVGLSLTCSNNRGYHCTVQGNWYLLFLAVKIIVVAITQGSTL